MHDLAVINLAGDKAEPIQVSLHPASGQTAVVDGLSKLAQSVIFLLGTERGSIQYDPSLGTDLFKTLAQVSVVERSAIDMRIGEAARDIKAQIDQMVTSDTPDSERLADLQLESVDYFADQGRILIAMSLTSVAGDSTTYTLLTAIKSYE